MGDIRVGTSGWHYPTGKGTWDGVFYPPKRGRRKTFDELAYYAEHFNTVEINATFYGQPRAEVSRAWVERTPAGFEFSVKLYQKFTHPRMFEGRLRKSIPAEEDAIAELARPNAADLDEFRRGIDPLASSGKLGAILAQFPPSFKNGEAEQAYLVGLLESLRGYRVAVELRHRSWSDRFGQTIALLNEHDAAFVHIDEPKFRTSIRQNQLPNITTFYYLRAHGRNAKKWWHHEHKDERYDYLYSAAEMAEFSETLKAVRQIVPKTYAYMNNHADAKSVANAVELKHFLDEPIEGTYPDEFIARYPDVKAIVSAAAAKDAQVPVRKG